MGYSLRVSGQTKNVCASDSLWASVLSFPLNYIKQLQNPLNNSYLRTHSLEDFTLLVVPTLHGAASVFFYVTLGMEFKLRYELAVCGGCTAALSDMQKSTMGGLVAGGIVKNQEP